MYIDGAWLLLGTTAAVVGIAGRPFRRLGGLHRPISNMRLQPVNGDRLNSVAHGQAEALPPTVKHQKGALV
jgi:hypothetical protein